MKIKTYFSKKHLINCNEKLIKFLREQEELKHITETNFNWMIYKLFKNTFQASNLKKKIFDFCLVLAMLRFFEPLESTRC